MSYERRICTRSRARQDAADNANVRPVFELSKLPVEIQLIVLAMAAEDNKGLILLLAICQEWRNLIIGSPTLWCRLEVNRKTKKKKIDLWMSRSKGKISALSIIGIRGKTSTAKVFVWFSKFSDEFWAGLETIEIESSEGLFLAMIDAGIFNRLQLRNFCFQKRLGVPRSLTDLPFTTLTSLQITGEVGDDLLAMLDRNPLLTRLSLTGCDGPSRDVHDPKHVELRHLTHLELCEICYPIPSLKTFLHIPNLQTLVLRGSQLKPCLLGSCLASTDFSQLSYLRELRLRGCESPVDKLKRVLRFSRNITTLEVGPVSRYDTAKWLRSLNPPVVDTFLCPCLQHIKLSGHEEMDLESLVEFVEGRLRPQGPSSERPSENSPPGRPRRIMSVHLENQQDFLHPYYIGWLKANIPHFTIENPPEEIRWKWNTT